MHHRRIAAIIFVLTPTLAAAQDQKPPTDHGRVMACCLDVFPHKLKDTTSLTDTKNYVFRGKVISLGKDKRVSICYDVEHLRVAGAWVGKPFVYTSDKNMGPTVEGEMLFATKPGPGWAKDGKWDDPRVGKEGPLPRDWAHYKGLYLHDDKVVLSFTVGGTDVLETAEFITDNNVTILRRTINLGSSEVAHKVLLSDAVHKNNVEIKRIFAIGRNRLASIDLDDKGTLLIAIDASTPSSFAVEGERLILNTVASKQPRKYQISCARLPKGFDDKAKIQIVDQITRTNKIAFLTPFTKGGPARWTETLETTITPGDVKGPYTLDNIALPEKNPWNASIRFSGLDFFPDGRAALCTWDGDVWIVSGLDDKAGKVKWKRFASGLQQPLGLKIINGAIYTAGRDQITKLHDLNNDGEADFYENINNDPGLTLQRHEFVMDLQTDKDGNIYFCRSGHYIQSKRGDNCCIYKMSPDGKNLEKFATGFREPNGMSIGPDGTMTVADNEGNGIPQTPLYRLLPGKHYGFTPGTTGKPDNGVFKLTEKPIVWLGPKVDTSAGGQVWVTSDKWGPAFLPSPPGRGAGGEGERQYPLLHTSYGNCSLMSVLIDKSAEPWQGAAWKFPLTFNSGIMRARFNPKDGQLYVCGLRGWGTSAVKDGQFARVRYTGKDLPIPVGYRVVKNGIELTFSHPLDKKSAEDDDNWAGTWSNVLKKVPAAKEMQEMPITLVRLGADRKTVTIALDKLRIVPNFALQYRLKAADGASVSGELNGTIHRAP